MALKPYAQPTICDEDIEAVVEVLKSQYLTTGPKVPELENVFAQMVGAREAVASSNGTTALHLAALALGLKPGEKVIVASVTFLATANSVRMCGSDVVFADVDADTGLMTLESIKDAEARAGGNIRAVFVVHMGGYCCDMKAISAYARGKGWAIVEDACHALGGWDQGHAVGSCAFSDLTCFSLHATKSFCAGEGGMTTTNDPQVAARLRRLRNHGMNREGDFQKPELAFSGEIKNPWYYEMAELGYNYRMTDIQAALAISQLSRRDEIFAVRANLVEAYKTDLLALETHVRPVAPNATQKPLLHLFQVLIDFEALGKTRAGVMHDLMARGVGTQVHYMPLHLHPYYQNLYGELELKGALSFYNRVLALPLYASLSPQDVREITAQLKETLF